MRRVQTYKTKVARQSSAAVVDASHQGLLQIIRWDPTTNHQRIETFEYVKKQDFMVLDLLTAVKAHQDPSLAFRASCCEGVCGSCAMNINGINSLACITFASQVTTVGPLPNFPVLKDLVVDLRGFFRQYEFIRPYVRNTNLQRYHVDALYSRYKLACRAILGSGSITTDPARGTLHEAEDHHHEEKAMTAASALEELLGMAVGAGDATKVLLVLQTAQSVGFVVDAVKAMSAIKAAFENFKKVKE